MATRGKLLQRLARYYYRTYRLSPAGAYARAAAAVLQKYGE